jgi:hypothetical protein
LITLPDQYSREVSIYSINTTSANNTTFRFTFSLLFEDKLHGGMRFRILYTASMEIITFWDTAPCSLVYRRFRDAYRLHYQVSLMMEAESTSETSVTLTRLHGQASQKDVIFIIVDFDEQLMEIKLIKKSHLFL